MGGDYHTILALPNLQRDNMLHVRSLVVMARRGILIALPLFLCPGDLFPNLSVTQFQSNIDLDYLDFTIVQGIYTLEFFLKLLNYEITKLTF